MLDRARGDLGRGVGQDDGGQRPRDVPARPQGRTRDARGGAGCIINTASVHSFLSWPQCSTYAASKGAVLAVTRSIALELLPHGIRVNGIAPGTTDTAMFRLDTDGSPIPETELAEEASGVPLGRVADPREIAGVALFLATDSASFVVGSCVTVDGGMTVKL
jgi:NAD(P)-dependent dehydrogenase (short-subunit alcohol dehydrogenase family)